MPRRKPFAMPDDVLGRILSGSDSGADLVKGASWAV